MTAPTNPRAHRRILSGKRIIAAIAAVVGAAILWYYIARPQTYRNSVAPACEPIPFEGSRFTVCRYDPARHSLAIAASGADGKPLLTFRNLAASLGPRARRVVFAMNAGMYSLRARPIGLYVDDGIERHTLNRRAGGGNFPHGTQWRVLDRRQRRACRDDRPLRRSHPAEHWLCHPVRPDAGDRRRSAPALHPRWPLAQDPQRRRHRCRWSRAVRHQRRSVSFGKFARLYRDRLGCSNALFLDGFVSSLWDAASGRFDQRVPLGPMIVVSERAPPTR